MALRFKLGASGCAFFFWLVWFFSLSSLSKKRERFFGRVENWPDWIFRLVFSFSESFWATRRAKNCEIVFFSIWDQATSSTMWEKSALLCLLLLAKSKIVLDTRWENLEDHSTGRKLLGYRVLLRVSTHSIDWAQIYAFVFFSSGFETFGFWSKFQKAV